MKYSPVIGLFLLFAVCSTSAQERQNQHVMRLYEELKTTADSAAVYARLGLLYLRLEKADSAQMAFAQALAKRPNLAIAHTGLGRVYLEFKNDPKKALPHFEKAIELDTTDVKSHEWHIQTLLKLNHTGGGAREAANQTISRFPDMALPYLLLAHIYQSEASSSQATLYYYKKYLDQNPGDQETAYEFAFALYKAQKYRDLEAITSRMRDIRAMPLLAQALIYRRDQEGALAAFHHYIQTLPKEEKKLYEDISLVGTKAEVRAYSLQTDPQRREAFLNRFWLQKDPFKTSGGLLRRAEHYRRVWHARMFYGKKWPWDKRGEVYIRWGDPDYKSTSGKLDAQPPLDVQRIQEQMAHQLYGDEGIEATFVGPVFPIRTMRDAGIGGEDNNTDIGFSKYKPVTATSNWSAVPWEVWIYKTIGNGIEITFTDEFLSGNYDYAPMPELTEADLNRYESTGESYMQVVQRLGEYSPATLVDRIAAETPEKYSLETLEPLEFYFDALTFRGPNGQTELQVNFALPIDNIAQPTDPDTTVIVERRTALIFPRDMDLQKTKHALAVPIADANRNRGLQAINGITHTAPPGEYELAVEAWRQGTNRVGAYRLPGLKLPDYSSKDRLMLSDIQLSSRITPANEAVDTAFVRGIYYVQPQPSATFLPLPDKSMYIYFEIYNLTRDSFGQTHYEISYEVQLRNEQSFSIIPLLAKLGKKNAEAVGLSFEQVGSDRDEKTYLELPLTNLRPGRYSLKLTIKDQNNQQEISKNVVFHIPRTQ
jgi:GWxTD domain-containing protein